MSVGSWTQVACNIVNAGKAAGATRGVVIAVDLNPVRPIRGATFTQMDAMHPDCTSEILSMVPSGQAVDVLLSDMAPSTSGIDHLDHTRSIE